MPPFEPGWRALTLGSLPHTDPEVAWGHVVRCAPEYPCWPQLPRRDYCENMYAQFSEGFPGVVVTGERIYVDRRHDLDAGLERLYLAYLENDLTYGHTGAAYALGLDALSRGELPLPRTLLALKGQVTGPVSWGLTVIDENRRPILYDEVLADAVSKHLRLKAAWQEALLGRLAERTIMFIDEPYMASFGSAFVSLSREQVRSLLEEVLAGLQGVTGVHCCGNTDWSVLLGTSTDILSIDAYDYAETLALYPEDVARFLERGGTIAWGIVPIGPAAEAETAERLADRLEAALAQMEDKGVPAEALRSRGLVTPSCGLGSVTPALAEHVLELTARVAAEMRRRYVASEPAPATDDGDQGDRAEVTG